MAVSQEELGKRLRASRDACPMTQEEVARHLGMARSTVAQIELGNRAVTGLELDRLADLYGRDIRELLADDFREQDALVALFRAHPGISGEREILAALRRCVALGREMTHLERLLGVDRDLAAVACYPLPSPRTKWDAIQQGERVASEERRRLGFGEAPLPDVAELLETHGVRTAQVGLPDDISGITLIDPRIGVLVVVNREHHVLRRRFSCAHEYCHVLLDRDRHGMISRSADRDELAEVRANAFAASFLMPADGVRRYVHGLGKGLASRLQAEVFDETEVVAAQARTSPGSQALQTYDVVQIAHHFGVSRLSALFRLRNLRLLSEPELDALRAEEDRGVGREVAEFLNLPEPDHKAARDEFRHRFLGLGLEALRRGEITRSKLRELAVRVAVPHEELDLILEETGLDSSHDEVDVLLPGN